MLPYLFLLFLLLLFSGGCAPARPSPSPSAPFAFAKGSQELADLDRLALLWRKRTQEERVWDYPIGPGDVLEIEVPGMEELESRTVRVSGEGTLDLPFVGSIRASGQTEEELRKELLRRLEAYMYHPEVNLFVREYRSRQVAVIGAVAKPGLYSLASGADTILDMISMAGGMTEEAAPRIHFIPAEPAGGLKAREVASAMPVRLGDGDPLILKRVDPIVVDLKALTRGGHQLYLTLPVRPGDVIMVPGGGDVLVEGWVAKPGSYKITAGLTVLGAVAAAGGPLFAADTTSVKVIRIGKQGEKNFFLANLQEIKEGREPDLPVQEGDVIEVSSSALKLPLYGFYSFFSRMFHIGAALPLY